MMPKRHGLRKMDFELLPKFAKLYLKAASKFGFKAVDMASEKGKREVVRYLLVNRLIPFTRANIKTRPTEEFFVDGECLSAELKKRLLEVETDEDGTEEDEQYVECEDGEDVEPPPILGIYVNASGEITGFKKETVRRAIVTTEISVTPKKVIEGLGCTVVPIQNSPPVELLHKTGLHPAGRRRGRKQTDQRVR